MERAEDNSLAMERLGLRLGLGSVVLSSQTFGKRFGTTRILVGCYAGSMVGKMWCMRLAAVFATDCAFAHVSRAPIVSNSLSALIIL